MLNLLNNASDAVEDCSVKAIGIDITCDSRNLYVSITDTGPGIPADIRDRIMQPFFTTKPIGKGTGLGLSISQNLIDSHYGKLDLTTKNGRTAFVITLPIKRTQKLAA